MIRGLVLSLLLFGTACTPAVVQGSIVMAPPSTGTPVALGRAVTVAPRRPGADYVLIYSASGLSSMHDLDDSHPDIDYEREMVVLASLGQQSTGGYSIEIKRIEESDEHLHVFVETRRPGRGCLTTTALTWPAHAVTVRRIDKSPRFHVTLSPSEACQ